MKKNLTITEEQAIALYPNADESMKKVFESTFGKKVFAKNIMDRIQTLQDIEEITGQSIIYNRSELSKEGNCLAALYALFAIAKAYNEDNVVDWNNTNQYKYLPQKHFSNGQWILLCCVWNRSCCCPARLVFLNREHLEDAMKKFPEVFEDFFIF